MSREFSIQPPTYHGGYWILLEHDLISGSPMHRQYTSAPTLEHLLVQASQMLGGTFVIPMVCISP
jgi:hypothetical protein